MNSERWNRIQLLFEEALAHPDIARRNFLDSVCGEEIELRDEVLSLLAVHARDARTETTLPTAWFGGLAGLEADRFSTGEIVAGRYRIQSLLGRGGMGEVYEAWDEELSIPVALKTLHLAGSTDDAHRRLKLEGFLARSVWHPNVCRSYDLGRHGEERDATWFLTMEVLRGETLSTVLQEFGRLHVRRAQSLAEQMAAGLGAAHQAGVVHRDFKPGNVLLVSREGTEHAVVTDFGIARSAFQKPSGNVGEPSSAIFGTPAYMAPEQLRGDDTGPAADIYALGVVLYEMVTGSLPWIGGSSMEVARRRLSEDPPSPRTVRPELDECWERVILRCLAREPNDRFGRAEEVADALSGRSVSVVETVDASKYGWRTLPFERDVFVGRETEIQELGRHLIGGNRLVTLVGAGGMGKTRLAIRYGWRSLGEWPGGVWFCDLTEARSVNDLALSMAQSLEVQLGREDPLEQLGHAIASRGRCLVILDNFEQLVEHAESTVGRWLARAHEGRFLVTSRESLGLENETVQVAESLSPEAAFELFDARARWLRPGLELIGSEAEAAKELVRLIDGIPLAVELAAARMRVMNAAQIVQQMRKRFSLLTGGGIARHETLAVAIDSSWDLLSPRERSVWTQCSVFEGGFTLDAAEGVLDLRTFAEAVKVLDVIQSLADKSLLRVSVPDAWPSGVPEARFGMYVSLQEYARLKLLEDSSPGSGWGLSASQIVEERHGQWFALYGTPEAIQKLSRRDNQARRRQVERELDNLLVACRRAVSRRDTANAVATYRALWAILDLRGPFGTAVELGRAVLRVLSLGKAEEADVLRTLAQAEWFSGMVDESRTHMEAALALARSVSDRHLESEVLGILGGLQVSQGEMEEGSISLAEALRIARALGDRHLEGVTLNTLSVARRGLGRTREARLDAELALEVARRVGNRRLEGSILSNLGLLLQDEGGAEEARAHYESSLRIHREMGNRRMEGNAHSNLGGLSFDQGRMEEARAHMETALAIHRGTGARFSQGIVLTNLGFLCQAQDRYGEARAHFEQALAIERELGNRSLEGRITGALALLHQERGEQETALMHYEKALSMLRAAGDRRSEGFVLGHLATLHQKRGAIDIARQELEQGELLLRKVGAAQELGQLLCIRGELEREDGKPAEALASLREAEDFARRIGAGPQSELGRMLAKLHQSLGLAEQDVN